MTREPFARRLERDQVVVGDGGWGTMLFERGLEVGQCPEAFNLSRPEVIEHIAALYVESGAELVTTNTFGGSPLKLAAYSMDGDTEAVNRAAVEAVRRAVGDRAWVSASVGPSGRLLTPFGDTEADELSRSFVRQIRALAAAGADLLCVETMTDLTEACLAVEAARQVAPHLPVLATMTFDATPRGFFTVMGVTVSQAATALTAAGADAVGSNCGNGSENMVAIAREYCAATRAPVVIQSNAGLPENRAGEVHYPEGPQFMADQARHLVELGVRVIGGCCGSTPEHIRAIRRVVDSLGSRD
jgi:5-methyltetrahydrofolate--homocysteine methyltransferase